MDDFVKQVKMASQNENHLKSLVAEVKRRRLTGLLGDMDKAIAELSPEQHSVGWILILDSQCVAPPENFIENVSTLLNNFNPNLAHHVSKEFVTVCETFTNVLRLSTPEQSKFGVLPLLSAVKSFRPTEDHITPLHCMFLQLCLLSKSYTVALSILDQDVYNLSVEKTSINDEHILKYFYYGGLIYAGLKQFDRALIFFSTVLSIPAGQTSEIMIEAQKKLVLISMIQCCEPPTVPNKRIAFAIEDSTSVYGQLLKLWKKKENSDLIAYGVSKQATFEKDKTWGLVKQAMKATQKRKVLELMKIYKSISLSDLAEKLELETEEQAESVLLKMVIKQKLPIKIDDDLRVVWFNDPFENLAQKDLNTCFQNVTSLNRKVQNADAELETSQRYNRGKNSKPNDRSVGAFDEMIC